MTSLTTTQKDGFRNKLVARQQILRRILQESLENIGEQSSSDRLNNVSDSGELSAADVLADINIIGMEKNVEELVDIDVALRRLSDGSYSVCLDCQEEIGLARLMAFPTAKRCVSCQARHENRRRDATPSL